MSDFDTKMTEIGLKLQIHALKQENAALKNQANDEFDTVITRNIQLERENAMFRRALADALSTFQHENEVIVTAERVEAWKAALSNGNQ